MTTLMRSGFVVRETEAAVAFVAASQAGVANVKPLWLPRKKIVKITEIDAISRAIETAQDGRRQGVPVKVEIDEAFATKVGA
jgi:hypothetical protein